MNTCPDRERFQDLLDGFVVEPEVGALRRHLADCTECSAELARLERVFSALQRMPLEMPRPELADQILAHVLPSRRRRRQRIAAFGWGYAACVAAFAGIAAAVAANPPAREFLEQTAGRMSHRFAEAMSFVTHVAGVAVLGVAGGLDAMASTGERLAPIGRALNAVLTTPSFAAALLTAFVACAVLLWWLRPAPVRRRRFGPTDVGILGFWGMA